MSKSLKIIMISLVALVAAVIGVIIYRMFFQFDMKEVAVYVDEEAAKYGPKKRDAACIIMDGVEHILSSHNLCQQVLRSARATGTDREQELVSAAINQCKSFRYLSDKV